MSVDKLAQKAYLSDETGILVIDISDKYNPKYVKKVDFQAKLIDFKLIRNDKYIFGVHKNYVQIYTMEEPMIKLYDYPQYLTLTEPAYIVSFFLNNSETLAFINNGV